MRQIKIIGLVYLLLVGCVSYGVSYRASYGHNLTGTGKVFLLNDYQINPSKNTSQNPYFPSVFETNENLSDKTSPAYSLPLIVLSENHTEITSTEAETDSVTHFQSKYSFYVVLILLGFLALSLLFLLLHSFIRKFRFLLRGLRAFLFAVNSFAQTHLSLRIRIMFDTPGNLNDVIGRQCFNGLCLGTDQQKKYQRLKNNNFITSSSLSGNQDPHHKLVLTAKILSIFLILLCFSDSLWSATKTWVGASAAWTNAASWSPAGAPVANDDIVFSTGTTITVSSVPTITINTLSVSNNTNVTLNGASGTGNTLTFAGGTGDDFVIREWFHSP